MRVCLDCGKPICKNSKGQCRKCSKTQKSYTYRGIHQWMQKNYGKAYVCEQATIECKGRFEWANISGKYKRDRLDWEMLCSCHHQKKHYAEKFGNRCPKGHEFTKENTYIHIKGGGYRQCKKCKLERQREYYRKAKNATISNRSINTSTKSS